MKRPMNWIPPDIETGCDNNELGNGTRICRWVSY